MSDKIQEQILEQLKQLNQRMERIEESQENIEILLQAVSTQKLINNMFKD